MASGRVQGKIAVITGGARGIGAEIGKILTAEGATVVAADLAPADGVPTATEGGPAAYRRMDVTDEASVRAAFDDIAATYGRIDILVNNAGVPGPIKPSHEVEEKEFDLLFDVDVKGVWLCTKHAVRHMLEQRSGSIVNMSSIYGLVGGARIPLYHAAKGAVRLMTKADAATYATSNIRVNSVHPGSIETELSKSLSADPSPEAAAYAQRMLDNTPVGHRGTPEDIAYGVLYLASDESRFVTGTELVVDGGYSAV
ncbi:SDR family NAD(P)-dependent oxidoreductase [Streptomyces sp. NBC_00059]|uniref:SDR family NAD(P)-dependent oxidoreductase n=1 Tax=Streptomyces sp. NBC_00059 TaxID=2975635 RepID=UPI0022522B23|nr:SDR family oxidoreductase [Streptomyces sp. NBC_00059]MCX5416193.1 SDR family oxidoreductase [Streptomyces sp. NBC_00059]